MLSGSWVEKYEKKFFLTKMYKKLLLTNDVALMLATPLGTILVSEAYFKELWVCETSCVLLLNCVKCK